HLDARPIAIEKDDLCSPRALIELAGHQIVESRTDRNDQIAVVDGHVGPVATVHAERSEAERMTCRKSPEPHKRACRWQLKLLGKLPDLFVRLSRDRSAANIQHRPL